MIGKTENIDAKTTEAEERYVPGARVVKALDFHSNIVGSRPIGDTEEEYFKRDMNCNWNNIGVKTLTIAGRDYSRLSVLQ